MKCLSSMNNIRKAVLVVCLISAFVSLGGCKLFKVTDPDNPRFDITKFRISDYKYSKDLKKEVAGIFRIYFPLGMSRGEIEKILVENEIIINASRAVSLSEDTPHLGLDADNALSESLASYYVVYTFTPERHMFSLTPGGGIKLYAFYDDENKLVLMVLGSKIVHE